MKVKPKLRLNKNMRLHKGVKITWQPSFRLKRLKSDIRFFSVIPANSVDSVTLKSSDLQPLQYDRYAPNLRRNLEEQSFDRKSGP